MNFKTEQKTTHLHVINEAKKKNEFWSVETFQEHFYLD